VTEHDEPGCEHWKHSLLTDGWISTSLHLTRSRPSLRQVACLDSAPPTMIGAWRFFCAKVKAKCSPAETCCYH
jgi:hypothetical protein